MRAALSPRLENARELEGRYASKLGDLFGAFLIEGPRKRWLKILSSGIDDTHYGWEHVSVSTENGTPSWAEMCFVKSLFWEDEECVMQLHPPKSEYVNNHPYVLHLWRPLHENIPRPHRVQV